jgi:hypothetical protein
MGRFSDARPVGYDHRSGSGADATTNHLRLQENDMVEQSKFQGSVQIRVTEDVTLENLNEIVARISTLCGCRTCGIMGVDLRLSGDPVELQQIAELPGVKSFDPQPSPW